MSEKSKPEPKKPEGKVFDVSRPGKTLASPTSRPVVIGHKAEAQSAQISVSGVGELQPQESVLMKRKIQILPTGEIGGVEKVAEKPTAEEVTGAATPPDETTKAQITLEDKEALAATALDAVTGPPEVTAEEEPKKPIFSSKIVIQPPTEEKEASQEAAPEAEKTEATSEAVPAEEQPAETSSLPDSAVSPDETTPAAEEEPAPEPHIEPLFNDSGVIVSHHDHHRRRHGLKVFGLILLIVILAAVGLDIALDLGLLTLEGIPHTDFL